MASISDPRATDAEASSNPLDPMGWASLVAGLLVVLITFFTSYSHIDLIGFRAANEADRERYRAANERNKRLAAIESRLDALLLSADSSSPAPPATDSN
jgi:hypothetical protein